MFKLLKITSHTTVILGLMFAVFLVLDLFNPMMNFLDNPISHALLTLLSLSGILEGIAVWRTEDRRKTK